MVDAPPAWAIFLLYPVLCAILFICWLLTRGSKTEIVVKGFGVELTIREDRMKTVAIVRAPVDTDTTIVVSPTEGKQ